MANSVRFLEDRFIAFSGIGMIQPDKDTPMLDADIDTRHKCLIALEDNVERRDIRDCEDVDLTGQSVRTRYKRLRLTYNAVTPQIMAFWTALHLGEASVTPGTPQNEIQTLARTGTVSGGAFTITVTLEGLTAETAPIAWNASTADIQDALTAARMKWIEPGDVTVGGNWTGGMTLTFVGRLAKANIPAVTIDATALTGSTPGISVTETQAGANAHHEFVRAISRQKVRFGFALGYLDGLSDPIKYSGFVVESINPTAARRQPGTFEVSIVGMFEGEEMTGYVIPDCENPTPLESSDVRVVVNSNWETTDVSTLSLPLNDNIALDDSAYGFVGIDPDILARAKQITYNANAQIFSTETDAIAVLAENERTQAPVDSKIHFGMPGNRLTYLFPETKVKFASGERFTPVGASERIAGNYELTALKDDQDPPIAAEAYLDQTEAFLQVSE